MNDLEITKLCAEALLPNVWAHGEWNPLHDDAQAMALVKEFRLNIGEYWRSTKFSSEVVGWQVEINSRPFQTLPDCTAKHSDLNRAICECVAKRQLDK